MNDVDPLAVGLRGFRVRELILPILQRSAIPWEIISGPRKMAHIVSVRHEVYYTLKKAGYSNVKAGEICNRDPTTIINGARRHKEKCSEGC